MGARGHVTLAGKDYLIQDESYLSKIVPMFRPQLQVSGISHEALDQYLYMVWDSWDRGSSIQSALGRWGAGMYGVADFVDMTRKGRLQLQPKVTLSMAIQSVTNNWQGPRGGSTWVNDPAVGSIPWVNPGNAAASDEVYTTVTTDTLGNSATTYYLKGTGFGFTIPTTATVNGIVVEIRRFRNGGLGTNDAHVRIVKNGVISTTDRALSGVEGAWGSTLRYVSYGRVDDLWGETWTPADINASTFGVVFSASINPRLSGGDHNDVTIYDETASIDSVRITVYYTPVAPSDNFNRADSNSLGANWIEREVTPSTLDDFNRADFSGLGANWTESEATANTLQIVSNQLRIAGGGNTWSVGRYTGVAWDKDQKVSLTFKSVASGQWTAGNVSACEGPGVRLSGSLGAATGYCARVRNAVAGGLSTTSIELVKFQAADLTVTPQQGTILGSVFTYTLVANDVLSVSAVGAVITVFLNGSPIITVTDSSIDGSSSNPGVFSQRGQIVGDNIVANWDDFTAEGANAPDTLAINTNRLRMRSYDGSVARRGTARWADATQETSFAKSAMKLVALTSPVTRVQAGPALYAKISSPNAFTGLVAIIDNGAGLADFGAATWSISLRRYIGEPLTTTAGVIIGTASSLTVTANDLFSLEKSGTTIVVKQNGTTRLTVTDSSPVNVVPGFAVLSSAGAASPFDSFWDDWTGDQTIPSSASVPTKLVGLGDKLYAFTASGPVFRLLAGESTWKRVAYDYAINGAVVAADVGSITIPFVVNQPPPSGTTRIIAGTDTGGVWYAAADEALSIKPIIAANGQPVRAVVMYRNAVVVSRGDIIIVMGVDNGSVQAASTVTGAVALTGGSLGLGTATFKLRYIQQIPGQAVAFSPFNQVLMAAIQAGHRGSLFAALTADQIIDVYGILGSFHVQSLATWGSSLVYAGFRQGQQSQVYTYPEILADRLPTVAGIPYDILSMLSTPEYLLMSFNNASGLWWMDDEGSGPYCQTISLLGAIPADATQITRSAVMFDGSIFYSVDNSGVFKVTPTTYAVPGASQTGSFVSSGSVTSGWFDGGFPELQKEGSDVVVRLDSPLLTGQAVEILARRDDEVSFTSLGTMSVGENAHVFTYQNLFRRIDMKIAITGAGGDPATSTPVVTSCILRYIPVPVQKRVWSFTVRAQAGIRFLDGTPETRTADQIISDLFGIKGSGVVTFSSALEPTQKNVYVSDVSLKGQLLGKTPTLTVKDEGFLGVELLEA